MIPPPLPVHNVTVSVVLKNSVRYLSKCQASELSMFGARTTQGEEREIARHPTHDNPKPDRRLGFDWYDATKDIAGQNNVVIVICEPYERELFGSPDDATWAIWQQATQLLKERGLIIRHSSGAGACWGASAALIEVEAELPPAQKQASACHPKPPGAIRPLYHPCNPYVTLSPPQFHTLSDGNGLLVGYGAQQMVNLSEHFGRLSANKQTFGARCNEAKVASACFRQAACNRQVMSICSLGAACRAIPAGLPEPWL